MFLRSKMYVDLVIVDFSGSMSITNTVFYELEPTSVAHFWRRGLQQHTGGRRQ